MGGVCAPSHAARSAETYCLILFLTVRFTLWTNKGNAIMSATKKKKSAGAGEFFLGGMTLVVPHYAHGPGIPRSLPMPMALVFPGPSLCSWPWYSQVPPYAHGPGIPRSLPMLMTLVFPGPSLCSWPWYSQVPPYAHDPGIPRSLPMLMALVFPGPSLCS